MDNLDVVLVTESEQFDVLNELYMQSEINGTFGGYRVDRIVGSEISFLIKLGDKPIGFILLVREFKRKNDLSIDIAISKEYRKNGYGKKAMEIFKEKYVHRINESLIAEVNKQNVPANKIINVLDVEHVDTVDDSNIYSVKR